MKENQHTHQMSEQDEDRLFLTIRADVSFDRYQIFNMLSKWSVANREYLPKNTDLVRKRMNESEWKRLQ